MEITLSIYICLGKNASNEKWFKKGKTNLRYILIKNPVELNYSLDKKRVRKFASWLREHVDFIHFGMNVSFQNSRVTI